MPKRDQVRRTSSWLLIAGGVLFALQGARDWFDSRWGQFTAQREFAEAVPAEVRLPIRNAGFRPQPGDTIAKLILPRLNAELYVVEGTGADDLRRGPGHMTATAMPGEAGNCVIAGHRDTHFRVLRDIRRGDSIILETRQGRFVYRVKRTQVVSPDDTASLRPSPVPILHLITCYPFYYVGAAPKRMIVEAVLARS